MSAINKNQRSVELTVLVSMSVYDGVLRER